MSALTQVINEYAHEARQHADALGEILRAWAFPGEGFGCYSTFELRPEFQKVEPTKREFEFLWGRPFDDERCGDNDGWSSIDSDEIQNIRWFKHPNGIEVGWHWDGDGCLAFYSPELEDEWHDGSISNTDCKKDYDWEWGERRRR